MERVEEELAFLFIINGRVLLKTLVFFKITKWFGLKWRTFQEEILDQLMFMPPMICDNFTHFRRK